jgi:hypothetical protein
MNPQNVNLNKALIQGCTNPRCQVTVGTKLHVVAPNICGPQEWHFLHIILLVPRMLRKLKHFLEVSATLF